MTVKEQIKAAFGTTGLFWLLKMLKPFRISIDAQKRQLTLRQAGKAPTTVNFDDIESFVNGGK